MSNKSIPKTLVILESFTKANKVSEYLGDKYEVCASNGHIRDLPPEEMGINIKKDFTPKYKLLKDKKATLQNIMNLADKCDHIFLASDLDREGEFISASLYHYLRPTNLPIDRIVFEEITKSGIQKGISNIKKIDTNLCKAQEVRRIIDRLVGYSISPFLQNHYKTNLSGGRVQSAMVNLIVEREKEIQDFKPEEYWNIFLPFTRETKETFITKYNGKIKNKDELDKVIGKINKEKYFIVDEVKDQDKKEYPSEPFITSTLQQHIAKKYGLPADKTMQHLQSLFENGIITYPRTDHPQISPEVLPLVREYLKDRGFNLPKSAIQYSGKNGAQGAHECIRPTSVSLEPAKSSLKGNELSIYTEIWKYFLASQLLPAIYSTLQVKISGGTDKKLVFKVAGKALKDPQYLSILEDTKLGKIEIPLLKIKEILRPNIDKIKPEQKHTQPPPRFNDATIIKLLEDKEIGRPATIASMIKTITVRNYVEKSGSVFRPTKLGIEVAELLGKFFSFVNAGFTAAMEKKLDLIADGKLNSLDVLKDFYSSFKKELDQAYIANGNQLCSKCGDGIMLRRTTKNGEFSGCSKFCGNLKKLNSQDIVNTGV